MPSSLSPSSSEILARSALSVQPQHRAGTLATGANLAARSDTIAEDDQPLLHIANNHAPAPSPLASPPAPAGAAIPTNAPATTKPLLNFANEQVGASEILAVMASALDRNLLLLDPLPELPKITVHKSMPVDEAIDLLQQILASKGFDIVFSGDSIVIKKAAARAIGLQASHESVHAVRLNFTTAKTFVDMASSFIPRDRLILVPSDPTLVLFVGPAAGAGTFDQIAQLLDIFELKNSCAEVLYLQGGDPAQIADKVRTVFGQQTDQTGFPKIVPLVEQGALLIIAPASFNIADIRVLIDRLDRVTSNDASPLVSFRPKHRSAADIWAVVQNLAGRKPVGGLANGGLNLGTAAGSDQAGNDPIDQIQAETAQQFLGGSNSASAAASQEATLRHLSSIYAKATGNSSFAGSLPPVPPGQAGTTADVTSGASDPAKALESGRAAWEDRPASAAAGRNDDPLAGVRRLVSATTLDRSTNRLLFSGSPGQFAVLRRMLEAIDEDGGQVLIEAQILEVQLNDTLRYGLQYAFSNARLFGLPVTGSLNATTSNGTAGLLLNLGGQSASVIISALDQVTNVSVVSSPKILVESGETAKFHYGASVPTLTRSLTTPDGGGAAIANQIDYRDTGISLEVTPTNLDNGHVELSIDQGVSGISSTTVAGLNSPVFDDRSVRTKVKLNFGDTMLLGGVIERNRNDNDSGLPVLHRLPMFGWLFGETDREGARNEFVLMLTPRLYRDTDIAPTLSDTAGMRFEQAIALWQKMHVGSPWPMTTQRVDPLKGS